MGKKKKKNIIAFVRIFLTGYLQWLNNDNNDSNKYNNSNWTVLVTENREGWGGGGEERMTIKKKYIEINGQGKDYRQNIQSLIGKSWQ